MSNVEITLTKQRQLDKLKVPSINQPYFANFSKFFVIKLKLLRKLSDFLILSVTHVTSVSNFIMTQLLKVVNSKVDRY